MQEPEINDNRFFKNPTNHPHMKPSTNQFRDVNTSNVIVKTANFLEQRV